MKSSLLTCLLVAAVVMSGVRSGLAQEQVSTVSTPTAQTTHSRDGGEMAADVLLVRPVSFAATAVGAAIFVVALPFAAIAGDVKGAGKALVGAPAAFTFKRKLGDFSSMVP